MEPVRAFIAIELPDSVKATLSDLQSTLKGRTEAPVKWVQPSAVHLTIKFLGDVASSTIPDIASALSASTAAVNPFRLSLGEPGTFPNLRAPRVVWVGVEGDTAALAALQRSVERALLPLGFKEEKRGFSAHLTLGRVRDRAHPDERRRLGETVASLTVRHPAPFSIDSISLMQSTLTREGAIYDRLHEAALGRGDPERLVKDP
jgi:2'-5' RNA ligase